MKDSGAVMEHMEVYETGVPGEIAMRGMLTINHTAEIRRHLREMIVGKGISSVRIGDDSEADLSFLQLLCSACMTARKMGKSFAVSGSLPEKHRRLMDEAGYSRKKGCRRDTSGSCIWIVREDHG